MRRRSFLKSTLAGAATLAIPQIGRTGAPKTLTFVPHADLASLDPVWTTADVTRNFAVAVYDTLYGYDAEFNAQPQMVEGHVIENDGLQWDLRLRDGLTFHDGSPVRASDCVATITQVGQALPDGPGVDGPHRRARGNLRQDDPVPPEKAVSAFAGSPGRALLLDHAGAAGQDGRL